MGDLIVLLLLNNSNFRYNAIDNVRSHFTSRDIKFLPNDNFLKQSDSQKRKNRSNLGTLILQSIEKSQLFSIVDKEARSEGRYRCFSINYPKTHAHTSLRSELKLEFTESVQEYYPSIEASIGSIYSSVTKQKPEITILKCDHINLIFVEKFVGLLRRTAEASRGYSENEDKALVRHIYDLHLIYINQIDLTNIYELVTKIIMRDINQFGMRHKEFKENPNKELLFGLSLLIHEIRHRNRYNTFLGPLVYNTKPPTWEHCINSLQYLVNTLLTK